MVRDLEAVQLIHKNLKIKINKIINIRQYIYFYLCDFYNSLNSRESEDVLHIIRRISLKVKEKKTQKVNVLCKTGMIAYFPFKNFD